MDLLIIDTGDKIEGNGLYDASDPKGKYTLDIFAEQKIDVICSGNHELYKNHSSRNEYDVTVPNFRDSYLASNIDIIDPESGEQRPLAQRYKKFTTKNQGIRVLAYGFLYDFTGNSNNTVVQKVENTVKEKWFKETLRDREVDLFLVAGHIGLRSPEYATIFKAIRESHWDTPIQFFGGHTHIRDYAKYDNKAYALESGRYMETIGFQSITGLSTGGKASSTNPHTTIKAAPKFSRRYIDNNLFSFHHHTDLNETTFPTPHGRNVSSMISSARKDLKLDKTYGCAPRDYWTNRSPFPDQYKIDMSQQEEVLPDMVLDTDRGAKPRMVLTNTGALRFDIFEGPFTIDTTYTVSPFTSGFRYIKDVPYSIAKRLLTILNQEVPQLWSVEESFAFKSPIPSREIHTNSHNVDNERFYQIQDQTPLSMPNPNAKVDKEEENPDLTPGYTTTDDAGSDGDDTLHSPIKFYRVPNCLESRVDFPPAPSFLPSSLSSFSGKATADPTSVDLVYVDFIESYVLLALRFLGTDFAEGDTEAYMEGRDMTGLIAEWVKGNWPCE